MSQIKLVVFDMDGTIIEPRSSWAMIHDYFGTDNTEMLQMYIDHKISDMEFVKADIKLWNSKSDVPVNCLLYTSPSPRDKRQSRMPSSA